MSIVDAFTVGAVVVGDDKRRLQLADRAAYDWYLAELPPGLCVDITVSTDDRVPPPRDRQRAYWYGVVVPPLARYLGTSDRQATRDLLGECFGLERNALDRWMPRKASISWLSAEEMSTFLDWAIAWGRTVAQVEIPMPEKR
jgi:hypothetical protein